MSDRQVRLNESVKRLTAVLIALPPAMRRDAIDLIVTEYIRGSLHPKKRAKPAPTRRAP